MNVLSEIHITSSHLTNFTNASRLLFARWETTSLPMQPKFTDITEVRLATFGIAVVGADHPLAIPTKSRRSAEFIGYRMNLRDRWIITVLQIIVVGLSYIIYSTWDNDQNLTNTRKEKNH